EPHMIALRRFGLDIAATEAEFNATHKNIKVQSDPMPWDVFYQKLLTSVSSGSGPDIVAMDAGQIPKYAHSGVLQPIDDFYGADKAVAAKLVPAGRPAPVRMPTRTSGETAL
ncbi:extracellular solute-binding protein, partial [Streptomyces sp. NPDC006386]|uniref:extracellular solute-binding protein n=1 Tax=Streptomyces sp. NPDC006386 TaxID=3156762 RepID=UPI0033B2AAB6